MGNRKASNIAAGKWIEIVGDENQLEIRVQLQDAPRPQKVFTATDAYVSLVEGSEVEFAFSSVVRGVLTGVVAVRMPAARLAGLLSQPGFVTGLRDVVHDQQIAVRPPDPSGLPPERVVSMRAILVQASYSAEDADLLFYRPIPSIMAANHRGKRVNEDCIDPVVEIQLSAVVLFSALRQLAEVIDEPLV